MVSSRRRDRHRQPGRAGIHQCADREHQPEHDGDHQQRHAWPRRLRHDGAGRRREPELQPRHALPDRIGLDERAHLGQMACAQVDRLERLQVRQRGETDDADVLARPAAAGRCVVTPR